MHCKSFITNELYGRLTTTCMLPLFQSTVRTLLTRDWSGGLPERMSNGQGLRLIEPLRSLYKDEVRGMYQVQNFIPMIFEIAITRNRYLNGLRWKLFSDLTRKKALICSVRSWQSSWNTRATCHESTSLPNECCCPNFFQLPNTDLISIASISRP